MKQKQLLKGVNPRLVRAALYIWGLAMIMLIVAIIAHSFDESSEPHFDSSLEVAAIDNGDTLYNDSDENSNKSESLYESLESDNVAVPTMAAMETSDSSSNADVFEDDNDDSSSEVAAIEDNEDTSNDDDSDESVNNAAVEAVVYPPYWWEDTRMSYMDYRTITDNTSDQWAMQQYCYTDPTTGIRMYDGRYCIAVGSGIAIDKGTYIDVTLENGTIIPCVLADCKWDFDTIDTVVGADGGIIEFVVETEYLPNDVQIMGSNEAQFDWAWQSPVSEVVVYSDGFYTYR